MVPADKRWRFVVFGDDWGRHPSSSQHLISGYLGRHRVIWVNSIGMRAPRLSLYDMGRIVDRLKRARRTPGVGVSSGPTPEVVQPRFLPWHHRRLARSINQRTIPRQVRARLTPDDCDATVVWVSNPLAAYLLDHVPHDFLIYYCGDDFTAMRDIPHAEVLRREDELLQRADLVIFSSQALVESKGGRVRKHQAFLPHGVDLSRFPYPPPSAPAALQALKTPSRPVVGFFGIFADWIAVELVGEVARRAPDLTFLLLGEPDERVRRLVQVQPNVHAPGKVAHHELAAAASLFDVGLFIYDPHHGMTRGINPLKMLEYYALGLPVVSTVAFPGIDGAEELRVCEGADAYLAGIREALRATPEDRAKLRRIAERHAWETRRVVLSRLIADGLAHRP